MTQVADSFRNPLQFFIYLPLRFATEGQKTIQPRPVPFLAGHLLDHAALQSIAEGAPPLQAALRETSRD